MPWRLRSYDFRQLREPDEDLGRIVVELGAFVRLNAAIDEQLADLEERMLRDMPQLALRSLRSRTLNQSPDQQSPDQQSPDQQSPDHWSG